jgi:hypothetical protein
VRAHGIPEVAIAVGECVTRTGRGVVAPDGGRIWAWRARWAPRVTFLRCDRCGVTLCGDFGSLLAPEAALASAADEAVNS